MIFFEGGDLNAKRRFKTIIFCVQEIQDKHFLQRGDSKQLFSTKRRLNNSIFCEEDSQNNYFLRRGDLRQSFSTKRRFKTIIFCLEEMKTVISHKEKI